MSTVSITIPLAAQTFAAGTVPSDLQFRLRNNATGQIVQTKVVAPTSLPAIPSDGSTVSAPTVEFLSVPDGSYDILVRRRRMVGSVAYALGAEVTIPAPVPGTTVDALVPNALGATVEVTP